MASNESDLAMIQDEVAAWRARATRGRVRIYVASFAMDSAAFSFFVFLAVHAKHGLDLDARASGLLGTTTTGALALSCFASGWILSRRPGLRLHLLGAASLVAIALPLAYLASSTAALFVAGAVFGLGLGLFWPSLEGELARASPPDVLWRALGTFNLAWAAGIAIGTLGGSSLYELLGRETSLLVSVVGASIALLVLLPGVVPAPPPRSAAAPLAAPRPDPVDTGEPGRRASARGVLHAAWIANFVSMFAIHGINFTLPHVCSALHFDLQSLALILFTLYATRWVFFGVLRQARAWHESRSWLFGAQVLAIAALAALAFVSDLVPFVVLLATLGVFAALSYYSSLYHGLAVPDREGAHSSLHEGILSLGMTAGPWAAGELAQRLPAWPGAVFLLASSVLALGLVLEAICVSRRRRVV